MIIIDIDYIKRPPVVSEIRWNARSPQHSPSRGMKYLAERLSARGARAIFRFLLVASDDRGPPAVGHRLETETGVFGGKRRGNAQQGA